MGLTEAKKKGKWQCTWQVLRVVLFYRAFASIIDVYVYVIYCVYLLTCLDVPINIYTQKRYPASQYKISYFNCTQETKKIRRLKIQIEKSCVLQFCDFSTTWIID